MPLLPKVVGGVTVRERPRRHDGEPKYKRLEFIRPRSPGAEDEETWPIIYSSEPVRGIQLYQPAYHHQQWHQQRPSQAQQFAALQAGVHWSHPAVQARFSANHPIHSIPAPALSNGFRPKQIEARPAHGGDDEFIAIMGEAKKDKKKGKGKDKGKGKKKVDFGHVIFEDSSDSEYEYVPLKAKKKAHRHR